MVGQVKAIGKGGQGVIFVQGRPVFLDGVIEDEMVEFTITKKTHSMGTGSVKRILQASPDRVIPPCSFYPVCGGCNFQHIAYEKQVTIKREILKNNLKKIARLDVHPAIHTVTSPAFRYRTRTVFKIREGAIGFLQRRSHRLVKIDRCHLVSEPVNTLLKEWRQSSIITQTKNGELLVLTNGRDVSALLISGRKKQYLGDKREIIFEAGNFSFRLTPENFIQANRFTLAPMLEQVEVNLRGESYDHSLDLFSGIGFFSLPLSRFSSHILSVERDRLNLDSLKRNLKRNRINNVDILGGDVESCDFSGIELILADPPRTGLRSSLIEKIADRNIKKILYFSCDSATFSRDISRFNQCGRFMKELVIIDNFPQTDHFEIFTCL